MKQGLKALALALAMAFSGAAIAADAPAPGGAAPDAPKKQRAPGVRGKVVSADATSIKITGRGGEEKTIAVDANTKVTIDGKEGKVTDIVAGNFVMATPETGTATEVKASTKPPQRRPGGKPGDAPKPEAPKPEAPAK